VAVPGDRPPGGFAQVSRRTWPAPGPACLP
jgi:hypothetical protein